MRKTTRKMWAVAAGVTGVALLATACGSGDSGSTDDASGDEKITLTVATFNEFGYEDLIAEYEAANPNITVEHKKAATSNEARDNLNTRLAAGSGLSDIEAIEVDWLPELLQYSDKFVDLTSDEVEGRWLDWKVAQATAEDGRLIGYGTDIGPEAIAYRSDLFAAAGLPTDREEVAALFGGEDATWDKYFEVGETFKAASPDVAFFDSSAAIFQGMVNQMEAAFEDPETGEITALENPEVKEAYDAVLEAGVTKNLSSHKSQWSEDWTASFQNNGFATMLAPGWMLGVIEGNADGVAGWDIANVFPGGGGNWGGSFLTVPAQGEHPEEAKALAAWLTAPEQQIKAFKAKGTFPSQTEALESEDLLSVTNEFFNNAPTGQILSERALAVNPVPPFKGPNYFAVSDAMSQAINRVDVDQTDDPATSWAKFEEAVSALG
ncbi:ABC transporter substrate-binding protein [Cellulomonas sp. 179-A 4D5 NHS]